MSQPSPSFRAGLAMPRTAWVDVAKALCIILVVMMHSTLGLQNAVGAEGFLGPVVAFFAPFRIPTFFVLSGLFLARALERRFSDYVRTRILHFAYFYLLWLAIHIALRSGSTLVAAPQDVASQFLIALIEPHEALWFIHLLIVFSLVAFALRRVNPSIVLAAAATIHLLRVETGSSLIDEFTSRGVFFAAGWALAPFFLALAKLPREQPLLSFLAVAAFAALNGALVFLYRAEQHTLVGLALGLAGAIAMVLVAAALASLPGIGPRAAALGRHSLAIYLAFTVPMAARALRAPEGRRRRRRLDRLGSEACSSPSSPSPRALLAARAVRGTFLRFLFVRPGQDHAPPAGRTIVPSWPEPRRRDESRRPRQVVAPGRAPDQRSFVTLRRIERSSAA